MPLLETLRAHWRWLKPHTYLFPSRLHRDCEQPITDKILWRVCTEATKRAAIRKRVTPHLLSLAGNQQLSPGCQAGGRRSRVVLRPDETPKNGVKPYDVNS